MILYCILFGFHLSRKKKKGRTDSRVNNTVEKISIHALVYIFVIFTKTHHKYAQTFPFSNFVYVLVVPFMGILGL